MSEQKRSAGLAALREVNDRLVEAGRKAYQAWTREYQDCIATSPSRRGPTGVSAEDAKRAGDKAAVALVHAILDSDVIGEMRQREQRNDDPQRLSLDTYSELFEDLIYQLDRGEVDQVQQRLTVLSNALRDEPLPSEVSDV